MLIRLDIDRLRANIKHFSKGYSLRCLVVKANAYGHGYQIAKYVEDEVDYFAVATSREGVVLRDIGVQRPILVLSYQSRDCDMVVDRHLTPIVYSHSHLDGLPKGSPVHIKLDTGMHRYGLNTSELSRYVDECIRRGLVVEGICSHIYSDSSAKWQSDLFFDACRGVQDRCGNVIKHIASTHSSWVGGDMLRLGIGAYTQSPVMSVGMEILNVVRVDKGHVAGYDGVFEAKRDSLIAIASGGYADGVRRIEIGRGWVSYKGRRLDIVGVCMDCILIDATDTDILVGEEVCYLGDVKIDEIASRQGTIPYEILTSFGARVTRRYYENNSRTI